MIHHRCYIHDIAYLTATKQDLYPDSFDVSVSPVGTTPYGCPSFPDNPLDSTRNPKSELPTGGNEQPVCGSRGQPQGVVPTGFAPPELPDVVHRFKPFTTFRYGEGVKNDGWPRYPKRLWQHNYYERIVRNERELDRFRTYIAAERPGYISTIG